MGIRFYCPRGHKLNVKAELAGKIGICPECGQRMLIPFESTRESTHKRRLERQEVTAAELTDPAEPTETEEESVTIHQPQTNALPDGAQIPPELPVSVPVPAEEPRLAESGAPSADPLDTNPLLTDPNLVWYARGADNQSYGPVTNVVMKSWIKEKRIGPAMLIWREGWSTWLEAKNVFPELEAIFTPPPADSVSAVSRTDASSAALESASNAISDSFQTAAESQMERKRSTAAKKRNKEIRDLAIVVGLIAVIILLIVILVLILIRPGTPASEAVSAAILNLLICSDSSVV